jgi:hypothetical protein
VVSATDPHGRNLGFLDPDDIGRRADKFWNAVYESDPTDRLGAITCISRNIYRYVERQTDGILSSERVNPSTY